MNRVIYKYLLEPPIKSQVIELIMGQNPTPLTVQVQQGKVYIWAEVDLPGDAGYEQLVRFMVLATGEKFTKAEAKYLGTFQLTDQALVWHVYEMNLYRSH